jgi:diadenosine tetraphosphatase ApaH/serine/threonine PP2A family protein phosphatase
VQGDHLFVHASPRNPIMEYLRKVDVMLGLREKIVENFRLVDWLCFIGHTHQPGIITRNMEFYEPDAIDHRWKPQRHQKVIINVGSVGQPRDGDWRASFATIEDDGTVLFHRVEYDLETTCRKINEAGLDPTLAERLRRAK